MASDQLIVAQALPALVGVPAQVDDLSGNVAAVKADTAAILALLNGGVTPTPTPAPAYSITAVSPSYTEGGTAAFTITRTNPSAAGSVDFTPGPGDTNPVSSGDVVGGFTATTVSFGAGVASVTKTVALVDNSTADGTRTLKGTISNPLPSGGSILVGSAQVSVFDNDVVTSLGTRRAAMNLSSGQGAVFAESFPFLNHMQAQYGFEANSGGSASYDANGWPYAITGTGVRNGFGMPRAGSTPVSSDNPTPDRYILRWEGDLAAVPDNFLRVLTSGNLQWANLQRTSIDSTHHQVIFDWTHTIDTVAQYFPASGTFKNASVVPLAYKALFDGDEIFHPKWLAFEGQWAALRMMDVLGINASTKTLFSQMRGDPRGLIPASGIWPIDLTVALVNKVGVDWRGNVPYRFLPEPTDLVALNFDTSQVQAMALYLRDAINANLNVFVNDSNEATFNFSGPFPQTTEAYNSGQKVGLNQASWMGARAKSIYGVFQTVFSNTAANAQRFIGVSELQSAALSNLLEYKRGARYAGVQDLRSIGIKRYSGAPYLGGSLQGANSADRSTILGWARGGASGVTSAIQEIIDGSLLTYDDVTLNAALAQIDAGAAAAAADGMTLDFYEGGNLHDQLKNNFTVQSELLEVMDLIRRVKADARFKTQIMDPFHAKCLQYGIQLNRYNDVGPTTSDGSWPMVPSIYTDNPALQSLKALQNAPLSSLPAITVTAPKLQITRNRSNDLYINILGGADPYRVTSVTGLQSGMSFDYGVRKVTGSTAAAAGNAPITIAGVDSAGQAFSVTLPFTIIEPVAYPFYRLIIDDVTGQYGTGSTGLQIADLTEWVLNNPDGSRKTGTYTATSSLGSRPPSNLGDGDLGTRWTTDFNDGSVKLPVAVQFADGGTASELSSSFIAQNSNEAAPKTGRLYGYTSNPGAVAAVAGSGILLGSFTNITMPAGQLVKIV